VIFVATRQLGQLIFFPSYFVVVVGSGMDKNQVSESKINIAFKQHWSKVKEIKRSISVPDPDPLVRGMDPDPSITKQKL
jgi:hypothetical protein